MKKKFILILVLAALVCRVNAQVQFSVGPGVGFNYAIHSSSDSDESLTHFGALLTSQLDMQLSRNFGIIVWVDFLSDMSAKEEVDDVQSELKINYLHLSPTLKYCFPGKPFYLFGGPGIGIKTKGSMKASYQGFSMEEDVPDIQTRIDFRVGAGYDFFLTKKLTLSPFVGFNINLNNVVADGDWKINVFQAGIILRYNLF
jgi:hypothetical protein